MPTIKCLNLSLLKSFLNGFECKLDNKPNGQSMYTFPNELVVNVYETGSVVFQGSEVDGATAEQIYKFIESVNAPLK